MPLFTPIDCPKDLECAICLEPWTDPVELGPCKHVFCKQCVSSVATCPECRKKIQSRTLPNRILVNMAAEVQMECSDCSWQGSREQVKSHTKCGAPKAQPRPAQGGVGGYEHQQHPNFATNNTGSGFHNPATAFGGHNQNQAPAQVISMAMGGDQPWKLYDLTQMEYDQIFCIFLQFDADDSGELNKPELKKLARWLNFAHTDHDIDAMFRQMDSDGSGSLSLEEFCTWLKHNRPDPQTLYGMSQTDYNYVLMQFHHYDDNANGELTMNQFVQLCMKCDLAKSQDQAQRIFYTIDLDHGGTVDLHEFLTYRAKNLQSPSTSGVYNPAPASAVSSGAYNPASSGAYNPAGPSGYPQQQQQQQPQSQQQPQVQQSGMYFQQQGFQQQQAPVPPRPQPAPPQPAKWAGPPGWERAMAPNGVPYYIDHNTKATHWQPPAGYPA